MQTQFDESDSDLPTGLGKPAQRALAGVGYVRLEQLTQVSEHEILQLHGMGPKALGLLRSALPPEGYRSPIPILRTKENSAIATSG